MVFTATSITGTILIMVTVGRCPNAETSRSTISTEMRRGTDKATPATRGMMPAMNGRSLDTGAVVAAAMGATMAVTMVATTAGTTKNDPFLIQFLLPILATCFRKDGCSLYFYR
jgi:hypothetical protein